jgi:hypothetical protein
MILLYVAYAGFWQAALDPRLWTEAVHDGSLSPVKGARFRASSVTPKGRGRSSAKPAMALMATLIACTSRPLDWICASVAS